MRADALWVASPGNTANATQTVSTAMTLEEMRVRANPTAASGEATAKTGVDTAEIWTRSVTRFGAPFR